MLIVVTCAYGSSAQSPVIAVCQPKVQAFFKLFTHDRETGPNNDNNNNSCIKCNNLAIFNNTNNFPKITVNVECMLQGYPSGTAQAKKNSFKVSILF